jgi:FixJ family two-component response regulator
MAVSGPLVFIVDDEPSIRIALGRALEAAGYEVELLDGAAAYLQCPPPRRPACLILDIRMPGISGPELCRAIKGTEHALPVIFMTGDRLDDLRNDATISGAVDTLGKPPKLDRLLDAVERAILESTPHS